MDHFNYRDGVLWAEDVPIPEVLADPKVLGGKTGAAGQPPPPKRSLINQCLGLLL